MLRNRYVIGLLFLALSGVVAWNVQFFLGRRAQTTKAVAAPAAAPAVSPQGTAAPRAGSAFPVPRDPNAWRRDPFRFRSESAGEGPKKAGDEKVPALQGILASGERRFALVDGRVVAVGDRLEGYRISAINSYSIRLKSVRGAKEISIINDSAKEK